MKVTPYLFADDGLIPNNSIPLLLYSGALELMGRDPASIFENQFERFGWTRQWRNGIYAFHHYHSTSHEVLGCYRGKAKVQLFVSIVRARFTSAHFESPDFSRTNLAIASINLVPLYSQGVFQ